MIFHCSKCDINWARLRSMDGEGDEQYEVCPVCLTDMHLDEPTDIETFIQCQITGRIINSVTGEEKSVLVEYKHTPSKRITRAIKPYYNHRELELKAIENYQDAIIHGDDPEKAYFDTFKQK